MKFFLNILLLLLLISCTDKVSFNEIELSHHSGWGVGNGTILLDNNGNLIDHQINLHSEPFNDSYYFKFKINPDTLEKISRFVKRLKNKQNNIADISKACPDCSTYSLKIVFSDSSVNEFVYYNTKDKNIDSLNSILLKLTDRRKYNGLIPIKKKFNYKTYNRLLSKFTRPLD